jgi:hypothetical protein
MNDIALSGLVALLTLASPYETVEPPAPVNGYIESVIHAGTGCGNASEVISPDGQEVELLVDGVAAIGPGIPITENRKNCQMQLQVRVPGGWSFALASKLETDVELEPNVEGLLKATHYFSGNVNQHETDLPLNGPFDGPAVLDTDPVVGLLWSPCGSSPGANANLQARLASPSQLAQGRVEMERMVTRLVWRRCGR